VIVGNGATHSQKDGAEGNGGSFKDGAEDFMQGVTRGYKDGLQPESLADDGNWLVKQNQPESKIETKSDTNLRRLYES